MKAEKVNKEFAERVIEKREPEGLFIYKENDRFVGIDNSNGGALVEEFEEEKTCIYWLENSSVEYYTGRDFGKSIKDLEAIK